MGGGDDDGAIGGDVAVVQTLVINCHAEEAGHSESHIAGVLFFDRAAGGFLALVHAEDELRAGPLGLAAVRQVAACGHGIKDNFAVSTLIGLKKDLAARDVGGRSAFAPQQFKCLRVDCGDVGGSGFGIARQAPQECCIEQCRARRQRRHFAAQVFPGAGNAQVFACALNRAAFEQQAHGEEVVKRHRRAARVFVREALEAREHAGPASKRQGRGVQPRFDSRARDAEGFEGCANDLIGGCVAAHDQFHVNFRAAAFAGCASTVAVEAGNGLQKAALAFRDHCVGLTLIEEPRRQADHFAVKGHVDIGSAQSHNHIPMAADIAQIGEDKARAGGGARETCLPQRHIFVFFGFTRRDRVG